MKIGKTRLKMSSGEVRKFGSSQKRNNFERVAQAVKHGWKPTGKGSSKHPHNPEQGQDVVCEMGNAAECVRRDGRC